jgi:succinate dehydrogenase/fumarate reductase flavoprotein subunit
MQLVNGTALTGRLLQSADSFGVDIRVSTPARRLLTDGAGKVTGAVVGTPEGEVRINAARGVVLAAGGFPQDVERRKEMFPHTPTGREHWTLAPAEASGDGISLGQQAGARFRTDVKSAAAWCPVSLVPYRSGRTGTFPHIMDRAKPGSIGVLRSGKRFVNEANGYYDYVAAMLEATPAGEQAEAWQIADSPVCAPLPAGHGQAAARAALPLPALRLPEERPHPRGTRGAVRHRSRRAEGDGGAVQPSRGRRRGPRLRPGLHALQPLRRRRIGGAESVAGPPSRRVRSMPCAWCRAALARSPDWMWTGRSRALDDGGRPIPGLYVAAMTRPA